MWYAHAWAQRGGGGAWRHTGVRHGSSQIRPSIRTKGPTQRKT